MLICPTASTLTNESMNVCSIENQHCTHLYAFFLPLQNCYTIAILIFIQFFFCELTDGWTEQQQPTRDWIRTFIWTLVKSDEHFGSQSDRDEPRFGGTTSVVGLATIRRVVNAQHSTCGRVRQTIAQFQWARSRRSINFDQTRLFRMLVGTYCPHTPSDRLYDHIRLWTAADSHSVRTHVRRKLFLKSFGTTSWLLLIIVFFLLQSEFVASLFAFMVSFNSLQLTDSEIGLFTAVVLLQSGN